MNPTKEKFLKLKLETGIDYLQEIGCDDIEQADRPLTAHLLGTHAILSVWGQPESVCIAGLLHALYGSDSEPQLIHPTPRREEVQRRFGKEVESLVYEYSRRSGIDDATSKVSLIHLASLAEEALYKSSLLTRPLEKQLSKLNHPLPPHVEAWMQNFTASLHTSLRRKN